MTDHVLGFPSVVLNSEIWSSNSVHLLVSSFPCSVHHSLLLQIVFVVVIKDLLPSNNDFSGDNHMTFSHSNKLVSISSEAHFVSSCVTASKGSKSSSIS